MLLSKICNFLEAIFFRKENRKTIFYFVPRPTPVELTRIIGSGPFMWVMDYCEKTAMYRLNGCRDAKEREEAALILRGVMLVGETAKSLSLKMARAESGPKRGNLFGLDDNTLLREAENGNGNGGK